MILIYLEPSIAEHQESLVPAIEPDIEPVAKPAESSRPIQAALQAADTSIEACATTHKSLFQSQNASDTESDSEAEHEYHINEQWAKLQLELDTLRMASGEGKKGKKGKGNQVMIETPEIRRLKDKISRVEKEYMFTRKDASTSVPSNLMYIYANFLYRCHTQGFEKPKGRRSYRCQVQGRLHAEWQPSRN